MPEINSVYKLNRLDKTEASISELEGIVQKNYMRSIEEERNRENSIQKKRVKLKEDTLRAQSVFY